VSGGEETGRGRLERASVLALGGQFSAQARLAGGCSSNAKPVEARGPLMPCRLTLIAVFSIAFANPALANWWIVRSSDGECLVVDLEPTSNDVAKVGNGVYQTKEQAEADAKRLCKEPKANVPRKPRNVE
jgi:hypothetical protein